MISVKEAIASIVWSMVLPQGRYAIDPGDPINMTDYASLLHPMRTQVEIPARRGDSLAELLHGADEWIVPTDVPFINEIKGRTDG